MSLLLCPGLIQHGEMASGERERLSHTHSTGSGVFWSYYDWLFTKDIKNAHYSFLIYLGPILSVETTLEGQERLSHAHSTCFGEF